MEPRPVARRSQEALLQPNYELEIRRKILASAPGETHTMPIGRLSVDDVGKRMKAFARARRRPIVVLESSEGFCFKRITEQEANAPAYSEMDGLEIGESHLFELPPHLHQRIRMAASQRNRQGLVFLSCRREGQFIRVIRQPLTPEECSEHAVAEAPPRESKYGLERLATERELTFHPANHTELRNLRVAVSTKGLVEGWKLTCRKQLDGSIKVFRLDDPEAGRG